MSVETLTNGEVVEAEVPELEAEPDEPVSDGVASALSRMRELKDRKREAHHLDLVVPGWEGLLVARYRPPGRDSIKRIVAKQEKSDSPNSDVLAEADLLIASLDELFCKTDNGLEPVRDGKQTRWDGWCDEMGLEYETARQALFGSFHRAIEPDLAIGVIATRLIEWASSVDEETDTELLGE